MRDKVEMHVNCLKYIFMQKEINMKQTRWLELITDYNIVLQTISVKSMLYQTH